ncbi:MAG: hypothetical protein CBD63_00470 [Candidatus Pelagibacter sp. TMED203]|nr:MAG: hypothetical protein CBD63_00470 [Candidatus Pelagibacter sp. TMED203]|tara:strand:- start:503 stop:1102 length:600 start_codon:yes stop_codon:yes gene_type:complete
MTKRKKRILTIQIVIFIIGSLMIFFTYYNKNDISGLKKTSDLVKPNPNDPIENGQNTNTFENIEYKGIDLNGNRYVIMSEMASFDIDKPELIDMKIMSAIFYFKDGTILKVKGDYGTYNNKSNDMEFRENIVANYIDNYLYADNLDYYNSKNLLTIYGNVKTESIKGNISADNIEIDISKRTVDLSMFGKGEVKVKIRN